MTETNWFPEIITFLKENEQYGDDWSEAIKFLKEKQEEANNLGIIRRELVEIRKILQL